MPAVRPFVLVAACLLAVVTWYAWPALAAGALIGAPNTDVVRAAWGLDHTWESLPWLPTWTTRIAFPVGVKILLLPQASMLIGAPLVGALGPVIGYDLWIVALWASAGFGSAFLAYRLTGSAAAAALAGTVMVSQPMLFYAVTDGTAEFVAWWSVPAALGALHAARWTPTGARLSRLLWALAAGVLLGVVAVDSPYHAVFCAPFVVWMVNWRKLAWYRATLAVLLIALALLAALYVGFPIDAPATNNARNSVSLLVWQRWESQRVQRWDYTLGTGFVPWHVIAGLTALALLRPFKALPWLVIATLALAWAMDAHPDNLQVLRTWLGSAGAAMHAGLTWFNANFHPPIIRFPRRWLIPMAQAMAIAAAIGMTRIRQERHRWLLAMPACAAIVVHTESLTHFRADLPRFVPPSLAFTTFIAESDNPGAVLFLPMVRRARQWTDRQRLPVFAAVSQDIASADQLWLQVACRRPSTYWPDGLRTVAPRPELDPLTEHLFHFLDDLSTFQTTGQPPPQSVYDHREEHPSSAEALVDAGLGFIAVDESAYRKEDLDLVRWAFATTLAGERHFDDGTGVTVLQLRKPVIASPRPRARPGGATDILPGEPQPQDQRQGPASN